MFAKVFSQIFESSIAEDYRVRLVFEDFLKLADKHGIVDMTAQSIGRRTNVPIEIVSLGIAELEKPDASSRTPDFEGRRIIRLDAHRDWGWRIVNFEKYRMSASKEMLRMAEADRKSQWRKNKGLPPLASPPKKEVQKQSTEAEADMSHVCPGQSGTQSPPVEAHSGFPKTTEEAVNLCSTQAFPVPFIIDTWNKAMSRGGMDARGQQIRSWVHYVSTELKYDVERKSKAKNGGYATAPESTQIKETIHVRSL